MPLCHEPQALLFDLGGVLIDIDFDRALRAWAPYSSLSAEDLKREFGFDLQYQRHERGEIDAAEYFDHLASVLRLSASRARIASGNSIFFDDLLDNVRAATDAGFQAVHVRSPEDVRNALRALGHPL
jgi:FMN phosphatase YigB (HAD superfamily)